MKPHGAARVAWQGAMASALLSLLGTPIDLLMGRSIPGMPMWPDVLSMCVAGVLLAWLLVRQGRPSERSASAVFLLNNAAVVLSLWVTSGYYAAAHVPWVPFQANKLGVLAVAMLTPANVPVGITTIALYTGGALLRYWTFDHGIRGRLPASEPWAMTVFAVFAAFLFVYRLRRKALEQALLHAQAETDALELTTLRFMAIQDLANTPLQTLEANAAILADVPGTEPYVARMRRALARLHEWHRILRDEIDGAPPSPPLASFDAKTVLRDSQRPPPRFR